MIYFAEVGGDGVTLALVAIVGTVITALFKLLNDNTNALSKVAHSSQLVADETKELRKETRKGNKEAKDRNGHLAELVVKQSEATQAIADQAVKQITRSVQKVDTQTVEHQTVKDKVK